VVPAIGLTREGITMNVTRRDALLGATAAAAVTGLTVAPLAMKAAGVKAALTSDPVLPAYEAFEAVRREYIATDNHIDAVCAAVEAEMPPEPHFGRRWLDLSVAERDEGAAWRQIHAHRVEAIIGGDQDEITDAISSRIYTGYYRLMDIRATTVAGLLCQVRAWWTTHEDTCAPVLPEPGPEDCIYDPEVLVQRLYHDIARLAGGLPS